MQSPLPVRDGVNATRLRLPEEGPWETAMDYMMHRWGHIDPQGIADRFDAGEIVGEGGIPLDRTTPLRHHTFIWYYRTLPPETRMPVELNILHQDEHLLVVDKPHFLPTTPGGTYIQESALVRLRNQLQLPDLIPMHRLDRMTAGILLLSTNPETRGKYQVLFEKRQVARAGRLCIVEEGQALWTAAAFLEGEPQASPTPAMYHNRGRLLARLHQLGDVLGDGAQGEDAGGARLGVIGGAQADPALAGPHPVLQPAGLARRHAAVQGGAHPT